MKPLATTNKQSVASTSNVKTKKHSKEKRKVPVSTGEASTSYTNSEKSPTKDSRNYIGYNADQLGAIIDQTTGDHLTEDVATAFVEDINYKLRFVIHDALTKARLSGRRGLTSDDINDTFECLGIEKVYGNPNKPTWLTMSEPNGQNIHYLEDPVINLFDLAESTMTYIEPKDCVVTRKYYPPTIDDDLKKYFKLMCRAVIEEDRELRIIALKDIINNSSIGPIVVWFYNYIYTVLRKDITYDGLTIYTLEFLECLETNPISGLSVSEKQLESLSKLLFQRLLKANGNPPLIKPICRIISLMSRRIVLRKFFLNKMITKYVKLKRLFLYPYMCLANEFGFDGVMVVIVPKLKCFIHIARYSRESNFISEILRSYHILCSTGLFVRNICSQYYDLFGDSIIPFWQNKSYPSSELPLEYDWLNVKKELYKRRRIITPIPNYNQKKISIEDAFEATNEMCNDVKNKRRRDKMRRIHPTNFIRSKDQTYVIIGKRTLLATVLTNKSRKFKCTYHTMMYHNL